MTSHPAQLQTGSARRSSIEADGVEVAVLQTGEPGRPPALLVPGFTGSKEDFAPLLDPLADAGFHITAIDLPGQYETPGPDDRAAYSVDRLGTTVLALARALGGSVHLLGHSFGGLVARAAVIADAGVFASLTLMSSGPAALDGGRRERMDALAPVLEAGGMAALYGAMQNAIASEPGYVAPPPELADFLQRRFLAGAPAMLFGMADALRDEPDRVEALAATGVRTLVVYGENDDAWAPHVQADMARHLDATRRVITGAAHSPAVENTHETVAAVLEFWKSSH